MYLKVSTNLNLNPITFILNLLTAFLVHRFLQSFERKNCAAFEEVRVDATTIEEIDFKNVLKTGKIHFNFSKIISA